MDYESMISRRLHEEHAVTLVLWNRLEQALAARGRAWPPAPGDDMSALLGDCAGGLADEVSRHFEFEETELFPRLADAGEEDIAQLLIEEHASIRQAAAEFSNLHRASSGGGLQAADWQRLRMLGLELAERMVSHVQKEEMSLLPMLEDLIDADTDRELFAAYAMT